jgi:hypothetical protein
LRSKISQGIARRRVGNCLSTKKKNLRAGRRAVDGAEGPRHHARQPDQQKRVPPMVVIGVGGQDAQRGKEYDTVSGVYAQFVERDVLPLVEKSANVTLTKNPEGRATMGLSSSGSADFTMAWFYPKLYRRVLAYSPTIVNQQWPYDPSLRGGAYEYHSP